MPVTRHMGANVRKESFLLFPPQAWPERPSWWPSLLKKGQNPIWTQAAVTLILTRQLWLLGVGEYGGCQGSTQIRQCPKFSSHWCNTCEILLDNWKPYCDPKTLEHVFLPQGSTTGLGRSDGKSLSYGMCRDMSKGHTCILRKIYCGSQRPWALRGKWPP